MLYDANSHFFIASGVAAALSLCAVLVDRDVVGEMTKNRKRKEYGIDFFTRETVHWSFKPYFLLGNILGGNSVHVYSKCFMNIQLQ